MASSPATAKVKVPKVTDLNKLTSSELRGTPFPMCNMHPKASIRKKNVGNRLGKSVPHASKKVGMGKFQSRLPRWEDFWLGFLVWARLARAPVFFHRFVQEYPA